ncbi:uncharacterized protein TRIVIDRAFT_69949 [Trichoderma virens Gv29-8]|uniref:Uncharacterized protein n=1 Tax=Hypocrea virens (strain Gv29-8 / FGSC 10586) TaxID=413071 RepID=G9MX03_HYPVG|nr:uncharacterized protein TRIVIDRAFT_69949 [Trichoderma virens Gv29-8]EHK20936.1 hypothetical protein TRIVIDRAFT_69949 [Trichoderma virens Gv29-8]UKZ52370.1 hypothetical protein TrVGV298_006146 [Trichoderma virens]
MEDNHELRDLEVPSPGHDLEHLLGNGDEESPPIADHSSASAIAPPDKPPTARVQPPSRRQRLRSNWHSIAWKVEILSWIASACCFVALVITLRVFDVGEFFLEISFGSGIGQLKWLNALQRTPLADFHVIDEASRGAWGSAVLIASRRGGLIASLGAFITIAALGIGTFVQQALNYDTIYPASGNALIPIAQYMNGVGTAPVGNGGTTANVDSVLTSAPYLAFFNPPSTNFTATAHCSTGNCTWSSYQSLGFCNTCKNLSRKLKRDKIRIIPHNLTDEAYDTNVYTLPNGFGLTGIQTGQMNNQVDSSITNGVLNVSTTITPDDWSSVAFPHNGSVLISVFAVAAAPGTIPEQPDQTRVPSEKMTGGIYAAPVAFECMLQFCVRNMSAVFANGTLHETVVSVWTNETQGIVPENEHYILRPPHAGEFRVLAISKVATGLWLNSLLSGSAHSSLIDSLESSASSDLAQIMRTAMNSSEMGFTDLMDNLANSLSLSLRSASYQPSPIHGKAFAPVSHAVVTWEWLILPAFELVASLVFLVIVMMKTRKAGLVPWTNNILAVFFHGFDQRPMMPGIDEGETAMEKEAHGLLVQFQAREEGGRLITVNR